MDKKIILDEDQKDCLQELMNIAYGFATASISQILDKFATLSIPKINTISSKELNEYLNQKLHSNKQYYISNQLVNGNLSGENIFLIDEDSGYNLAKEFDLEDDEIDENEIKDIVLEITNILSSATSGKLASLINATVSFNSPHITKIESLDQFDKRFESEYAHVIIIATELNFKDQNIKGELMILTREESSIYLQEALTKVLDEL
jgi:chemotaxis protein CheC